MRHVTAWVSALVVYLLLPTRSAAPCSLAQMQTHALDAKEKKLDQEAPKDVQVTDLRVSRGSPNMRFTSCDSAAGISFRVAAEDARTTADRMGYLIEQTGGRTPGGSKVALHGDESTLLFPKKPVRPFEGGHVFLNWYEGDIDLVPVDVTLQVMAVDLAGNRSAHPTVVHVVHDGFARTHATYATIADAQDQCDKRKAPACTWLGKQYRHGVGVTQSDGDARQHYAAGCKGGDPVGCELGAELEAAGRDGNGKSTYTSAGDELLARAAKLYQASCKKKDAGACRALADLYADGRGVKVDRQRTAALVEQACDYGDLDACRHAVSLLRYGANGRKRAAKIERRLCDGGDNQACMRVASGLERSDATEAERLYRKTCDAGDGAGCVQAGLFVLGQFVDQDHRGAAATLLESACRVLKDSDSCELAGAARALAGQISAAEAASPLATYEQQCKKRYGRVALCVHVALLYETGTLVAVDDARAAALRNHSCDYGHTTSCVVLGDRASAAAKDGPALAAVAKTYWKGCMMADAIACVKLGETCERLRADDTFAKDHERACRAPTHTVGEELAEAYEVACTKGSVDLCVRAAALFVESDVARAKKQLARACKLGDKESCARSGKGVTVSGSVTGAASTGAYVALVRQLGDPNALCRRTAPVDAKGRFSVAGVCPGKGEVRVYRAQDVGKPWGLLADVAFEAGAKKPLVVGALALLTLPVVEEAERGDLGMKTKEGLTADEIGPRPDFDKMSEEELEQQMRAMEESMYLLRISRVDAGGAAAQAGLAVGDRILAVDGRRVGLDDYDSGVIRQLLVPEHLKVGAKVSIRVRRKDQELDVTVVAAPLP